MLRLVALLAAVLLAGCSNRSSEEAVGRRAFTGVPIRVYFVDNEIEAGQEAEGQVEMEYPVTGLNGQWVDLEHTPTRLVDQDQCTQRVWIPPGEKKAERPFTVKSKRSTRGGTIETHASSSNGDSSGTGRLTVRPNQ